MKKIFTLIAMALAATTVNAQTIFFTAADAASAGELNGKEFSVDNFKLTITDTNGKISIDENTVYFGDANTQKKSGGGRLKSGGKSSANANNLLTLSIPTAGKLNVFVRTGSNSATDRNVIITQSETELCNQVVKEDDAVKVKGLDEKDLEKETNVYPIISVDVAAGEVIITYPTGSMNFYGFELIAGSASVSSIKAQQTDSAIFNLNGQRVKTAQKGLYIIGGKKVVLK